MPIFSIAAWKSVCTHYTIAIFSRSICLAFTVTVASLCISYPCAIVVAGMPRANRQLILLLFCYPLLTSLLLRTYGWNNLLPLSWHGTLSGVGIALTASYLPFMLFPLLRSLQSFDPIVLAASADLGATRWQTFCLVTLPLTIPGISTGCILVFIPVLGEYLIPHFLGEGKVHLLSTLIYQHFIEYRNWPYACACTVLMILLSLVAFAFSTLLHGRLSP